MPDLPKVLYQLSVAAKYLAVVFKAVLSKNRFEAAQKHFFSKHSLQIFRF